METQLCRLYSHSFIHLFVLQRGHLGGALSDVEALALVVGCLCHDLDHRGTNNQFQIK